MTLPGRFTAPPRTPSCFGDLLKNCLKEAIFSRIIFLDLIGMLPTYCNFYCLSSHYTEKCIFLGLHIWTWSYTTSSSLLSYQLGSRVEAPDYQSLLVIFYYFFNCGEIFCSAKKNNNNVYIYEINLFGQDSKDFNLNLSFFVLFYYKTIMNLKRNSYKVLRNIFTKLAFQQTLNLISRSVAYLVPS